MGILKFIPEAWITDAILAAIASLYAWAQVRIHLTRFSTANQAALDSLTKIVDAIANAQAKTGHLPTGTDLPALEALALAQAKTEWPTIEKALVGDLEDIIHHKMAVATVVHPALLLPSTAAALREQLDPRLATANMPVKATLDGPSVVKATPGGMGGFVGLRMVLALGLLALGAVLARPAMAQTAPMSAMAQVTPPVTPLPTIAWTAAFFHGPTLSLFEVSPSHPHPVELSAGAGYTAGVGIGQFSWLGKQWDLFDVGALAIGSVVSADGIPEGGFQFGALIGTMGNPNDVPFVSLAILNTPYTALGEGWAQGGRPGASFALMGSVPL